MSGKALILGVGMTQFGRHLDRTHTDLVQEAVTLALGDAGIKAAQIDSTVYATVVQGFFAGEMSIPSQFALRPLGISGVRTLTVEAACASSTIGLHQAIMQVEAGISEVALVVGVEKLYSRDREKKFAVFQQPLDIALAKQYVEDTRPLLAPPPEGFDGPGPNAMMDAYAAQARLHMKTYGTTQRQIAAVAAKNHVHSVDNPLSQYRDPMTIEDVLAAPNVSWPLTVPMCAPISDGASAAIVVSEAFARRVGTGRAVQVRAWNSRTGQDRAPDDYANHVTRLAAAETFERAGLSPADCDLAEVHDASSIGEILQVEGLGLCLPGEAGPAAERGELSLGGRIPVNVSGGLVSKGHPLGATGTGQIHELVTQLRGEAGVRQVDGARIAVAENSGGFYGVEDGMSAVTILEKA
ncbi:thiolase family protein [Croceicoccus bisphenolivorans]|uniref:thiolase family protein n=1 Tax=Croceicoccus bisphenolivorans TaxID=1783232 RepID=UPI000829BBF1|nr:thiolase family protein [Croceicoccus bisphenolivorans]